MITRRSAAALAAALVLSACSGDAVPTSAPSATSQGGGNGKPAADIPEVLVGAGNIGTCGTSRDEATATLIDGIPGTVFTAGDNAFPDGSASAYANCFEPSWGRHRARMLPALGNHEYDAGSADGALGYFGSVFASAPGGYYSRNIGAWHVVVLNDAGQTSARNQFSPWAPGSAQERWLRADLAANAGRCLLAIWHVPLFLSSNSAGYVRNPDHRMLWDMLYRAGADVVVNGHQHHYERMAPMRPNGEIDRAGGIRQFNAGTGGADAELPTVAIHPASEARSIATGVLKLTLYADRYEWRFVPVPGETFTDAGSQACHHRRRRPPAQRGTAK